MSQIPNQVQWVADLVETTTVIANQIKPTPNIKNILTVIDMKINTTAETPEEASPQIPETIA